MSDGEIEQLQAEVAALRSDVDALKASRAPEFQHDIPMPKGNDKCMGVKARLRDLAAQEIGTSILLENVYAPSLTNQKSVVERSTKAKFITRTVPGGVRVWRVA